MRAALATILLTLALGTPALAGGWAVTTLDQLPPEIHAGQTYAIGYTIRQHGVTPVNVEQGLGGTTEIQLLGTDLRVTASFRGVQTGETGHYVAQVLFAREGRSQWQVTQGPFAAQPLGTVEVLAATAAAPARPAVPIASANAPQPGPSPLLITALLLAISGAAVLFGTRLAVFADRRLRA